MKKIGLILILLISFQSFAQVEKTAIVEHFTNSRCAVCGYKNPPMLEVLDMYPNVIHIAYHPSSPYSNCIFSQHNPADNDARTNYYNVYGATPRVVLNGSELPPQNPMVKAENLDAASEEMSDFSVNVTQSEIAANQMQVVVKVQRVSESSESNLSLYVGLAEEEINYAAPNGEDVHHHVFRLELGEESLSDLEVDEMIEFTYTYNFHSAWQNEKMFAYAVLQNDSKMVLQADKSPLAGDFTGIDNKIDLEGLLKIGPNPTKGTLFINNNSDRHFESVSIYNIHGQLIVNQDFSEIINVQTLKPGIYILQIQSIQAKSHFVKFEKH